MHRRPGFTLIELLIVVLIIGVLVAIAIPRFELTKVKAKTAALKSDLHNLATAEEGYFIEAGSYTSDRVPLKFNTSPGVTVDIVTASASGWSAMATHVSSFPVICAVFFGTVTPVAPATIEGLVSCQ
jgi:prepilin-type N-terminal cleavage/methylation domain-containing protein